MATYVKEFSTTGSVFCRHLTVFSVNQVIFHLGCDASHGTLLNHWPKGFLCLKTQKLATNHNLFDYYDYNKSFLP